MTEIEPQAFSSLASLSHLDLTGNRMMKLEDIMMRYPSTLKALYLDNNRLQSFHQETFSGQTTLEFLYMSDNKLERIPANVFVELINLFRLSLAKNKITVIEDNALGGLHQVSSLLILSPIVYYGEGGPISLLLGANFTSKTAAAAKLGLYIMSFFSRCR